MQASIDREIRNYLNQVKHNLSHLTPARRDALLGELESHINEALSRRTGAQEPTEADVKAVIAEMDPPESFKEVGRDSEPGQGYFLGKLAFGIALFGAVASWIPYEIIGVIGLASLVIAAIVGISTWRNPYSKIAVILSVVLFIFWIMFNTVRVVETALLTIRLV